MAAFHNSQSYGGLGNYGGNQETQKSAQVQIGLSSYGQSLSSEQLDLNNLGSLPSYQQQYSSQQYGQSPPAPYGNQGWSNNIDLNDPQLLQQVDQIVSSLIENKRPVLRRQVITVPANTPGRVACITRRLPTPPPDIVERITVVKPPRDVINLCIEKPVQPGPCYQERNICGKPRKPVIQPRVVQVQPRSGPPPPSTGPCPPCPPQAQIQIFAGPQANSIQASSINQPAQTLGQQPWIPVPPLQQTQAYQQSQQIPSPYQQNYGQPQYSQQFPQQPQGQFSAQFQQGYPQQQAGYPQQQQPPIYQTPDGLAQTQSQTGFVPGQQPVYANNYPQQQGYNNFQPQQNY
jgi:hypothetical protein